MKNMLSAFRRRKIMMNLIMYPIVAIYFLLGAGSSLVIIGYLFVVLAQKIAGKIKHGKSFYA